MSSGIIINEDGSPVEVLLLYMVRQVPALDEVETIEEGLSWAQDMIERDACAPLAITVDGDLVRFRTVGGGWQAPIEGDAELLLKYGFQGVKFG